MAYPAIDADTLVALELDEQFSDLTLLIGGSPPGTEGGATGAGLNSYAGPYGHSPEHYAAYSGFIDQVSNGNGAYLYDTLPSSANSQRWKVGAPAPFNPPRCMMFFQGTASENRDYLVMAGPTANLKTLSAWVQPFQGLGAAQEVIGKEWVDGTPNDGSTGGAFTSPFYGGMQLFVTSANDGSWGASINVGGSVTTVVVTGNTTEHVRLRYNLWNHIGCTFDGSTFLLYCNGMLAASQALAGSISYGTGVWYCGALRNGGGTIAQYNGGIKRIRWEKVVKGVDYFFDCYTNVAGSGSLGPPNVIVS